MSEKINPEDIKFLGAIRKIEIGSFALAGIGILASSETNNSSVGFAAAGAFALGLVLDGVHRAKEIRSIPRPVSSTSDFEVIQGKIN